MSLPADLFQLIAQRFLKRAEEIALFVETGYSFEEWCNWEAFLACRCLPKVEVAPRPRYAALGLEDCRELGDLLITDSAKQTRVLVEVGIVHDWTGNKWIPKLDYDSSKLARMKELGILGLQVILLASKTSIDQTPSWVAWLSRIGCWNVPTCLESKGPLPPDGQILVRGWVAGGA